MAASSSSPPRTAATQDEVLAYAQKQHGSAKARNHPWANASRGLGLGTRDAIEGVGQLPGMAYDALMFPGKTIAQGINFGTDIPLRRRRRSCCRRSGTLELPTGDARRTCGRMLATTSPA